MSKEKKEEIINKNKKTFKIACLSILFILLSVGLIVGNIISSKVLNSWEDYYDLTYGAKSNGYGKDYAVIRPITRGSSDEVLYTVDDQLLTRGHEQYFIYFYSPGCSYCEKTETYVFRYLESKYNNETDGVLLYVCDLSSGSTDKSHYASSSDEEKIIDITHDVNDSTYSSIDKLKILNFPCLVAVDTNDDGIKSIEACWQGMTAIKNALNSRGDLY